MEKGNRILETFTVHQTGGLGKFFRIITDFRVSGSGADQFPSSCMLAVRLYDEQSGLRSRNRLWRHAQLPEASKGFGRLITLGRPTVPITYSLLPVPM